jgi:hypothetical protein
VIEIINFPLLKGEHCTPFSKVIRYCYLISAMDAVHCYNLYPLLDNSVSKTVREWFANRWKGVEHCSKYILIIEITAEVIFPSSSSIPAVEAAHSVIIAEERPKFPFASQLLGSILSRLVFPSPTPALNLLK